MACVCLCCIFLFAFLEFLIGCLKKIQRLQGWVFLSPCLIRLPGDKGTPEKQKTGQQNILSSFSHGVCLLCVPGVMFFHGFQNRGIFGVLLAGAWKGAKELGLPPAKLTCPLQIDGWKMNFSFGMVPL